LLPLTTSIILSQQNGFVLALSYLNKMVLSLQTYAPSQPSNRSFFLLSRYITSRLLIFNLRTRLREQDFSPSFSNTPLKLSFKHLKNSFLPITTHTRKGNLTEIKSEERKSKMSEAREIEGDIIRE